MRTLAALIFLTLLAFGQEERVLIPSDPNPDREPKFDEIIPITKDEEDEQLNEIAESLETKEKDDGVRVSVLGYHEF